MLKFPPEVTRFPNFNYLGGPVSQADGYAFPALADLRGLCPVLVLNAECDDLRSSGQGSDNSKTAGSRKIVDR
jgi:acetyl esterase/lipase